MKCSLCENEFNPENMKQLDNNDVICQSCYEGIMFSEMKIKPIKTDKNESISNNFGTAVNKLFNIDKDKEGTD